MSASRTGNRCPLTSAASHRSISTDIAPCRTGPDERTRASPGNPAGAIPAVTSSQAAYEARTSTPAPAGQASRAVAAAALTAARAWPPMNMPESHRAGHRAGMALGPGLCARSPAPSGPAGPHQDSMSAGRPGAATRALGPEDMIADLVDGVVQPLERIADPLPGQLSGLACGRVHAEPDVEQAADDAVQQVFGVLRLLREHGADQVDEVVLGPLVRGVP